MIRDEDNIDTVPVVMRDSQYVLFESIVLDMNERGEIVLIPDEKTPLRCPTIFMSDKGSEVIVEEVYHGHTAIARHGHWPVSIFKYGHKLDVTVTKDEPIKIVVINCGPESTSVGASLVAATD